MSRIINQIEKQLARLGLLCTDRNPIAYVVDPVPDLPKGWVRIYDDNHEVFGEATGILMHVTAARSGDFELGKLFSGFATAAPANSRD